MAHLTRAHHELFRRTEDERFETLDALHAHCRQEQRQSQDLWHPPQVLQPRVEGDSVRLTLGSDGAFALNHWSFSQLCALSGVSKDTLNKLSPETASQALLETRPYGSKPLQVLTTGNRARSIHGVTYSRLWNADLLSMLQDFAADFSPPPKGFNGGRDCTVENRICSVF